MTDGGLTGPSSEPRAPVITAGPVSAPVIRTGAQALSGAFIVEGIELFVYDFPEEQTSWLTAAVSIALALLQNWIEAKRGRRLIGAPE
jgi:hypothetical protein